MAIKNAAFIFELKRQDDTYAQFCGVDIETAHRLAVDGEYVLNFPGGRIRIVCDVDSGNSHSVVDRADREHGRDRRQHTDIQRIPGLDL
jgi:hypothetical protein